MKHLPSALVPVALSVIASAQPTLPPSGPITLGKIRMRDVCILADQKTKTYYMIGSAGRGVRAYTSRPPTFGATYRS